MNMPVVVTASAMLVTLGMGGALTKIGPWYLGIAKPSWNPPAWLFAPAWVVILSLSGWGAVVAWNAASAEDKPLVVALYAVNLLLNIAWSPLFFIAKRLDLATLDAVVLAASVVVIIFGVAPFSEKAAWLNVPYAAWTAFAALLTLKIARMNARRRVAA